MFAIYAILGLFSLALFIANIYCFKTKKYFYLFINCMLFLPDYYGFEFNDALPLLTVKRLMYLVFYVYVFINRKKDIKFRKLDIKAIPKVSYFLAGYFILRIFSNLYYAFTYSQPVKTIVFIIFEQLLLLVAVYLLSPTKAEMNTLVKTIVGTASVMFVNGILESYTSYRFFDVLYTVSRYLLNEYYVRLGLLRSTTSMGIPGIYGNMCVLVMPLILYLYECEKKRRYLVSAGLGVLAIIHSGARSDVFFLIFILGVYCIFVLRDKKRRLLFGKNVATVCAFLLVFITLMSVGSPYYRYFYVGSAKSILNEVGFDFDLSAGSPDESVGFGKNADGGLSRALQFSGILHAGRINPVFGLGSGAQNRGEVQYFYKGKWRKFDTYDLGLVEVFCDEGLIGLLGAVSALLYIFLSDRNNRLIKLMCIAYILTTLSTVNMYEFLMLYIILAFRRITVDNYGRSL